MGKHIKKRGGRKIIIPYLEGVTKKSQPSGEILECPNPRQASGWTFKNLPLRLRFLCHTLKVGKDSISLLKTQ
ncbi:hypothetical protein CI610_03719 [invertebrate metagenome]|uniref:Uncharacterized protein n=1 Tax=invertebrate metagenome TaxID=1711999 RepID=A0A2H9T2B8_9ZZZZ